MRKLDIVYFLKDDIKGDELRYSMRSVARNFPHDKVWFIGGQPKGLTPDYRMYIKQNAPTKWENVRNMLRAVCKTEDVSEDFWLFNDDFFILEPWDSEEQLYNGTLLDHIEHIERRHGNVPSSYTTRLRQCYDELNVCGYGQKNYAIHCPMLINRKKMLQTLDKFWNCPMFRCLYGNMWAVGGKNVKDNKIAGRDTVMTQTGWCSTTDETFRSGLVGNVIRNALPDPCVYEDSYAEVGGEVL